MKWKPVDELPPNTKVLLKHKEGLIEGSFEWEADYIWILTDKGKELVAQVRKEVRTAVREEPNALKRYGIRARARAALKENFRVKDFFYRMAPEKGFVEKKPKSKYRIWELLYTSAHGCGCCADSATDDEILGWLPLDIFE